MYQRYCAYACALFTPEGGAEAALQADIPESGLKGTKAPGAPKMAAFAHEVNALPEKSALPVSSGAEQLPLSR